MSFDVDFAHQHTNWKQWFPGDYEFILEDVQQRTLEAIERWNLTDLEPLSGGAVAYVFAATYDGSRIVLKVEPRTDKTSTSPTAEAMRAWHSVTVGPQLFEHADNRYTLLMEHVSPGVPLHDSELPRSQELSIIATVARRLHQVDISTLDESIVNLADHDETTGWRDSLSTHPEFLDELETLLALPATTLIHNDFHRVNILNSGSDWLLIDPKPALADPHADCFGMLELAPFIESRAEVEGYVKLAELDPELFMRWVRVRAMIRLIQCDEDGESPEDVDYWKLHMHRIITMCS